MSLPFFLPAPITLVCMRICVIVILIISQYFFCVFWQPRNVLLPNSLSHLCAKTIKSVQVYCKFSTKMVKNIWPGHCRTFKTRTALLYTDYRIFHIQLVSCENFIYIKFPGTCFFFKSFFFFFTSLLDIEKKKSWCLNFFPGISNTIRRS